MSKSRRHFTGQQKTETVCRYRAGKAPVSNLADETNLQPTQIHVCVKRVLDKAAQAFSKLGPGP